MEGTLEQLRSLTQTALRNHMYESAMFYADKAVSIQTAPSAPPPATSPGLADDVFALATAFYATHQYQRAIHTLTRHALIPVSIDARLLAAKSLVRFCPSWRLRPTRRPWLGLPETGRVPLQPDAVFCGRLDVCRFSLMRCFAGDWMWARKPEIVAVPALGCACSRLDVCGFSLMRCFQQTGCGHASQRLLRHRPRAVLAADWMCAASA